MAELFISYSKHNRPQALTLAGELREKGFSVWIDQGGIEGAQNWSAKIVEGINDCSTMILLISPQSVASRNVAREVHIAFEKSKNILPVVIEKVKLPANFEYPLAGLQHVYFHDRPAILQALQLLRAGIPVVEQLPERNPLEFDDMFIRVAVMPFDDLSPQHDNQWFADGMMDELITTLGQLDTVKVPPRSDVLHYREHRTKNKEIARELGVRYLIDGAVRKAGDRIRINATLIDTRQNEQLWGNQFNGTFEDVFAFQEAVSKHIADALKLTLTPEEEHHMEDRGTQNAEAYELYLKGQHEQYYSTKESYLRALDLFEQAVSADPKFVRAQISVASLCCVYYREYSKNPKWLKRAKHSLQKAFEISGETSRTLMIEGMIEWLEGNRDHAIETLNKSVSLDPQNYNSFNLLGAIFVADRNYSAAAEAYQRVVDLKEDTTGYFNLLAVLGSPDDADRRKAVAEKGIPVFERYVRREPEDLDAALLYAFVLWWAGRELEAQHAARQILARENLSGKILFDLGYLFYFLNEKNMFLPLIQRAIESGYREIETLRNAVHEISEPHLRNEIIRLLDELEQTINQEQTELL